MNKIIFISVNIALFIFFSTLLYINLSPEGHHDIDSSEYEIIGQEYAKIGNLFLPDYPNIMPNHTIGYHWFLGIIFYLFHQINYLFLFQTFLSLLCGILLYFLALKLFDPIVANVTLFLFSWNLGFLVYSQLILSEILLITFLLGFLYCFCMFIRCKKLLHVSLAGSLLGCSVIVKPVALFYAMPLSFLIFFILPLTTKKKLSLCVLFLGCFYFPITGYMLYNKTVFGIFTVTTLVHENLCNYFLPRHIIPRLNSVEQKIILKQFENTPQEKQLVIRKKIFFDILYRHPFVVCSAWLNPTMRTFFGLYSTQLKSMFNPTIRGGGSCSFFRMNGTYLERLKQYILFGSTSPFLTAIAFLESCWLLLQYCLVLIAFILLLCNHEYFLTLFFGSYISYFALITGHDGCGRYRLMFEPILLLLSALTLATLYYHFRYCKNPLVYNALLILTTAHNDAKVINPKL